jgi:hypothetical protein
MISAMAMFLLVGCDNSPSSTMRGSYENSNKTATLEVTGDKIIVSGGPMTLTANYTVMSTSGNDVTIDLISQGSSKGKMVVTVAGDSLDIKNNFLFGGRWNRK